MFRGRGRGERRLFPGFIVLLLAICGLLLRSPPPRVIVYLIALVVAFEMSLGFSGHTFRFLYDHVSAYRALRAPARLGIFVVMFLAAIAGFGYVALTDHLKSRQRRTILAAIVAGLLIEYHVRLDLIAYPNTAPEVYQRLAEHPIGVVAEFPMADKDFPDAGAEYEYMRNEGTELEQAVAETIRVGDAAGARVQISHLKVDSPKRWGASAQALALIDAARAKGIDVEADQYAYTAASSTLSIRFPAWSLEGGPDRIRERLNDAATWTKIKAEMTALLGDRGLSDLSFAVVALYAPDRSLNGLSMKDAATRLKGSSSADAQLEAAREMMLAGGASMVYHLMGDEDVARIMRSIANTSMRIVPSSIERWTALARRTRWLEHEEQ